MLSLVNNKYFCDPSFYRWSIYVFHVVVIRTARWYAGYPLGTIHAVYISSSLSPSLSRDAFQFIQ